MGVLKKKYIKISRGQISPSLIERTDIGILDTSGQELTNWQNSKYGALKTQLTTLLKYTFGSNKKIKLSKLILQDNKEGFVAFNGTDHTISVFDNKANLISNVYSLPQITESNYKNIQLAQNQDLILICTGDNPILKMVLNLPSISVSVFSIPASKILKAANVSAPSLNPIIFKSSTLPSNPQTSGIEINDFVYVSSSSDGAAPNTNFPWNVKKLVEYADPNIWTITSATIADIGDLITPPEQEAENEEETEQEENTEEEPQEPYSGYQVGDIITTEEGYQFQIVTVENGASLTVVNPTARYTKNPSGTNIATTGGSGTGMTVNISSATIPNLWVDASYTPSDLDVIKYLTNGDNYQYTNQQWIKPLLSANDIKYNTQWTINAASGVVKVTGTGNLLALTAPAGVDPENYAKSILYGVTFDGGESGIGMMIISGLTGSKSGQTFTVKTLSGTTIINFDNQGTKTGFTIKFSQVKVFDGDYPNTTNNPSSTTNYPNRILFYQQRLIIAGTRYNGSQMIFSQIGIYDDFTDERLDDSAFQLVIGSTSKEHIRTVLLNQGIQIFTDTGEWIMNDASITRTSGFTRNSSIGTNGVQPIIAANGTTLFPPRNGKGIIGFTYSYETASFKTPYITLFTNLLDNPINDLMLKRGLDSQDDTLIYICDDTGEMIVGNYLQEHEIQAFCSRKSENTFFYQTLQCEQDVIFLSERNGNTSLEIVDETRKTALASIDFIYNNISGVLTINHPQYNNGFINIYDETGKYIGKHKVINGTVNLPANDRPYGISEIGLNIHSTFISNPMNIGNETKALYKTINTLKIAVTPESRTEYLTVNGKYGRRIGDLVVYTRITRPLRDCYFKVENDNYPVEILSMEVELES